MSQSGVFRWSKARFLEAAGAGWFGDKRAELLGGVVYTMTTNPPHTTTTLNLEDLYRGVLPAAGWFVAREITIEIGSWLPIPDLIVARGPRSLYRDRFPTHSDLALIVEVSDTTYARDRGRKYRRYARQRIPVYWIVDLGRSVVEVHSDPGPSGYRRGETFTAADSVPVVIDGQEVARFAVADILP